MKKFVIFGVVVFVLFVGVVFVGMFDDVKVCGKLNCGVFIGVLGFVEFDVNGVW